MILRRSSAAAAVVLVAAACANPVGADKRVPEGTWGGAGIRLDVTSRGAVVEYDCAHGTIDEPLVTDRDGRFDAAGTHVREHGGPIRQDEPVDRHPARYQGRANGDTLRMTVTLTDARQEIGTFTLARGAQARLLKCL